MGIFTKYYADVLYYTMYRHNNIHSLTVKSSKTWSLLKPWVKIYYEVLKNL